MIRTYCKITGYEISRGEAFGAYKIPHIHPTIHPIFNLSTQELLDVVKNNYVKREHQLERVLLTHAFLRSMGAVEYLTPMFLDHETEDRSAHINTSFGAALRAFQSYNKLVHGDKVDREIIKSIYTYRVTKQNHNDPQLFTDFCITLAKQLEKFVTTGKTTDYNIDDDSFNLRLALLGVEAHGIGENDRLPKRFTPAIAEWAAIEYCKAMGLAIGGRDYKGILSTLTREVTERTNINEVRRVREVMVQILPTPTDYTLEKAKTLLTLKHLDNKVSDHTAILDVMLGIETEVVSTGDKNNSITWTVVQPKSQGTAPEAIQVTSPAKEHNKKLLKGLLARKLKGAARVDTTRKDG